MVLESEAGKTIEIDRIRELIERLSLRGWDRRVVLMDDADRMTIPAANSHRDSLRWAPIC